MRHAWTSVVAAGALAAACGKASETPALDAGARDAGTRDGGTGGASDAGRCPAPDASVTGCNGPIPSEITGTWLVDRMQQKYEHPVAPTQTCDAATQTCEFVPSDSGLEIAVSIGQDGAFGQQLTATVGGSVIATASGTAGSCPTPRRIGVTVNQSSSTDAFPTGAAALDYTVTGSDATAWGLFNDDFDLDRNRNICEIVVRTYVLKRRP